MLDALLAAAVVALLVALALAALYAVTVVPFLVAVDLAERRGCSTGRWAGCSLAAVVAAVGLALGGLLGGRPLLVLALGAGFAPAVVLALRSRTLGGRAGRHESPV